MIRSSLNLIIAWITIFSLTSSVCPGIFTHNEMNTYPTQLRIWQHGEYIDGTVVLRIINRDSNKTSLTGEVWTRPMLSLRIIHPNGTVNELNIDKDLEIQEFNWRIFTIPGVSGFQDPISIYALHRGYLIVRYFKALDDTNFTTYEEWGRIIDWYGNLYSEVNFGDAFILNGTWYTSLTAIITNVDPSKGFIRTAGENSSFVDWQQYMIDDKLNLVKLSEGNVTLPMEDGAAAILNTVATVDEGYSIILGNSTSNSVNPDDPLEVQAAVYDLKIGYNETEFSAPKLLYQLPLPNITISQMFCSISSTGAGQVCLLNVRKVVTQNNGTQNNDTQSNVTVNNYYVKLDFLISGSVTKITSLHNLPSLHPNSTTGWLIESIPLGGYLFYGYFNASSINAYGYYYDEIANNYEEWDFPDPTVLNIRGTLIILPNNTLLVAPTENNNTWSFNTADMPNYSGFSDNGYSNLLIDSTSPQINYNITKDTKDINITYHQPVELSDGDGFIWIYRIDDKFTTQNITRQFVGSNNDELCSISDDSLTVTVKVIKSTFSYPNSQYYVKVDNNFVRSKEYGEPLMGIYDNIWKFNTSSIEEPYAGTTSGMMRLTIEGTQHYYNLNSTGRTNLFQDIIIELSKILSISSNRLSTSEKCQVDNTIKPNRQIFIELRIQSSRTERSVKSIIDDLNEMIRNKKITAISLFPITKYLDENYGFIQKQNLWKEYWLRFTGAIIAFGVLLILFAIAWKKDKKREGRNLAVLQLGLIIFDFVMDTLFVVFNENKKPKFMKWFIQYGRVVSIFTVLSGADIEALSILYSTLAGFEIFNAPFSNKGKSLIFWGSWLNIFVEDIPQVIIQILYRTSVVRYDAIPLLTLISSSLNLLINIIGRLYQTINFCRFGDKVFEKVERTKALKSEEEVEEFGGLQPTDNAMAFSSNEDVKKEKEKNTEKGSFKEAYLISRPLIAGLLWLSYRGDRVIKILDKSAGQ
ncbi:2495_t:CDS:10, partial [Diversispora eburnea]